MTAVLPSTSPIQEEAVQFRSPGSEALLTAIGGAINYLLSIRGGYNLNWARFFTSGSWVAPPELASGFCLMFGAGGAGGGGGGGGSNNAGPGSGGGGGGGAGTGFNIGFVTVGLTYNFTIGGGGAGGAKGTFLPTPFIPGGNGSPGNEGGTTQFTDNEAVKSWYGAQGGHGGLGCNNSGADGFGGSATGTAQKGRDGSYPRTAGAGGGGSGGNAGGDGGIGGSSGTDDAANGATGGGGVLYLIWFESTAG